jgi:hypothetical protein
MLLIGKVGNNKMIATDFKETKVLKMKSIYIMPEATRDALKRDAPMSEAVEMDYEEVKRFIEENKKTIFKGAVKYKINVLTDIGWRGDKEFFAHGNKLIWFDPVKHYGDEQAEIGEVFMIQILYL